MCDHCGCRVLTPIARLMSEHDRLRELTAFIRHDLATGEDAEAQAHLWALQMVLGPHVVREEHRLFPKLRAHEELADHIVGLEAEHATLYDDVDALDEASDVDGWRRGVLRILDELGEHMFKEDFGLFPAALATLDGSDWDDIDDMDPGAPEAAAVAP